MLSSLLSPKTCADCRMCCSFEAYHVMDTPVFTADMKKRISALSPDAVFIPKAHGFIFRPDKFDAEHMFTCPALTDSGCLFGKDKPFECSIWPFLIMDVNGRRAVTISPLCTELFSRPLSELVSFLRGGLAGSIFAYADAHPDSVRPYYPNCPVLIFENRE